MNGSVYISFFQGQLESVLEQVVQLAVQEISKTVGSSLNSMLLETIVKEQENKQLKLQLQSRESGGSAIDNGSRMPAKCGRAADSAGSARTKPEQQHSHAPVRCTERGLPADTRRLEQKGRVVGQLKAVMEQVLDFAVCELTKIVEASFDDLLLEITKKEGEHHALQEHLGRSTERGGGPEETGRGAGRRRGSENDSASPSGSEDTREELADVMGRPEADASLDANRPAVLSMSHDWVPILDKVFGQKWCSDILHVKELDADIGKASGYGWSGRPGSFPIPFDLVPLDLEPAPTSPQQDPRWTPLEDMEVLSPENNTVKSRDQALSPTEVLRRRSSASMLHRLLTLPAQLLEEEEDEAAAAEALASPGPKHHSGAGCDGKQSSVKTAASPQTTREGEHGEDEDEEEEEEEEKDKGRKRRRRVWLECEECGRRFSRASLLKSHRLTHANENAIVESSSQNHDEEVKPPSPGLRCSECRRQFSSVTRLQNHVQAQHPRKQS